jgi:hypothetical protein
LPDLNSVEKLRADRKATFSDRKIGKADELSIAFPALEIEPVNLEKDSDIVPRD